MRQIEIAIAHQLRQIFCIALLLYMLLSGCASPNASQLPLKLTLWQGVNPPPNRAV